MIELEIGLELGLERRGLDGALRVAQAVDAAVDEGDHHLARSREIQGRYRGDTGRSSPAEGEGRLRGEGDGEGEGEGARAGAGAGAGEGERCTA